MRFFDERGPGFVTALTSAKGSRIARPSGRRRSPHVALDVPRHRFRGTAVQVGRDEVEAYFDSRPYGSRISAWTSPPVRADRLRAALRGGYERYAAQWPDGGRADVPVPDFWGGFRIVPDEVEFWGGRRSRLHDRIVFSRTGSGGLADVDAWRVWRRQPDGGCVQRSWSTLCGAACARGLMTSRSTLTCAGRVAIHDGVGDVFGDRRSLDALVTLSARSLSPPESHE